MPPKMDVTLFYNDFFPVLTLVSARKASHKRPNLPFLFYLGKLQGGFGIFNPTTDANTPYSYINY